MKACGRQLFCAQDLASQWLGPRSVAAKSFVTWPNRVRIKTVLGFSLNSYCQISVYGSTSPVLNIQEYRMY